MDYRKFGNKYVVRLEKGEEIVSSLKELSRKEKISLGRISGIGAVGEVEIGYFETKIKEYHSKVLKGDMEILNLNGNISEMNNEVYLHLHITIADDNLNAVGGHLNSAIISATGEIVIDVIEGKVDRELDEDIGLNLILFT
ncbi:PPC domain-containing DNA-binding protein [Paratissierella segnis]|jgi:hypothetical protein|uniref:DNA-binding protein n=1 Tax=Paratissierella segnis TaxID=2763679 RepID=A0A926EU84_9FIRM|nr:PPC domain-containing DNA-binding protein [Paratissierella segnis]MBC8589001.1 DNA-binding protein [Paratissierella segnis]